MDDDLSDSTTSSLGFKPQKENVYNKLLPYSDKLEQESYELFLNIKTNLVKAFLAREIRPGLAIWSGRLLRYIKIYGFKFSKEDHISLIKLFYELISIPNLEPTRINKFANILTFLLKKKELLSRDDLSLEWRPLFELAQRITKKMTADVSLNRYCATVESSVEMLIKAARTYFPVTATSEILNELRPKLCPHSSNDILRAVVFLESFLPFIIKPEEAEQGYKLWFDEFMLLWETCHNANHWENSMAFLMSNLAAYNIGYIDWEPHLAIMFVRFTRTLQLPVCYRQKQSSKSFKIDVNAMTQWIVSVLGGKTDSAFVHLEKFIKMLVTYLHAANAGRWSPKIRDFLKKLSLNFVQRIHNERYRKPSWLPQTPVEYQLSDADIDRFVNMMKPCIEHMVYSRSNPDMVLIFNYLASLRPNIVIPIVLEKLYTSMDSLTEPHKLTSAMMAVTAVSRYMVQGSRVNYPEGPTHVIPLLMNLLPGIDPNDIRKCFMTFNFIVQFINMIPLINSSEASTYYNDLTEEEHIVCEASAGFEDFAMQFFDRLCTWVESNSLEMTRWEQSDHDRRKTKAETMAETGLVSVITSVLMQSSPEIFNAALRKMYNFATTRIFEIKVSGKMVAIICQCFARINPKETGRLFIPHLCDAIEKIFRDNEDVIHEENLNEELLYNILLLSEIVDMNQEILVYIDRIANILDKILFMSSLQANGLGTHMLSLIMMSLTFTQPLEYRSSVKPHDTPVKDNLSVREWGKAGDIRDLNISWYMPGDKEMKCAQDLLTRYLVPQLTKLEAYAEGGLELTRLELRQMFKVILAALGCHTVLPIWEEPAINLTDSVLDPWAFEIIVGTSASLTMPDGRNVRKCVADVMHKVQKKLLETDEGDTKSFYSIIYIYDVLLFNKFRGRDFEFHWRHFHLVKTILEDKLRKKKNHLRHILIDRVMLHQEFRNECRSCTFTETHKQIVLDLFELSVSRYSEIRSSAQSKLFTAISTFSYSYTILTPHIIDILKSDSTENHKRFKGCLYVLLGPKAVPIVVRHDWDFIRQLWPLIVRSKPSEKPSIITLLDQLVNIVHACFPTIAINLEIPDQVLEIGYELSNNVPNVELDDWRDVIKASAGKLQTLSAKNVEDYKTTVDALLNSATNGSLHWRYQLMSICFLRDMVHPDVKYTPPVVNFFMKALINDSIRIRKIAIEVTIYILMQNKPKYNKTTINPYQFAIKGAGATTSATKKSQPGLREDNQWLLYDTSNIPKNADDWDEPRFVHNQFEGYYCWPKNLKVYTTTKMPIYDEMNLQLKEVHDFFNDSNHIEAIIRYYSIEEKKGSDKLNSYRLILFKYLFKLYENAFIDKFLPHLERLVNDKQEQYQRCAAEILSGMISGAKHWSFAQTNDLAGTVVPLLRTAFSNLSEETLIDWTCAIGMGLERRDPNRYNWLLEFLMNDPLNETTSFIGCARLYILQCALNQQPWRNAELMKRCLQYFNNYLTHPFQNVRDKISSGLTNVFCKELLFTNGYGVKYPKIREFFAQITPRLDDLYNKTLLNLELPPHANNSNVNVVHDLSTMKIVDVNDKENSIRLFKVVAKYITNSIVHMNYSTVNEHFSILPLACVLQSNEDDELATICTHLIALLCQTMTLKMYVPAAYKAIMKTCECPFWSARAVIAEFIPVFVFHNMAVINSDKDLVVNIQEISLKLLQDVQPEVRIKASHIISGFLHCNFIEDPITLLETFKQMAKTKLKPKSSKNSESNIRIRHAGVLGLCSYINAHPYDVPDFLPGIFEELGPHLNDPQPIPATILKTLSDFKRTHHANWELHKLKFTENELLVFNDLTVPPSYYA